MLKRNRVKRHRFGEALVEGVRPITRAIERGWQVRSFAFDTERPLSGWAQAMLAAAPDAERIALAPALMKRLSDKEEPSELLLVVRQPPDDLARIQIGRVRGAGDAGEADGAGRRGGVGDSPGAAGAGSATALVCVFARPVSPGNLGTVIRSCDALGADGLIVTGHGCDVYDPQTIRASQGSLFALPVVRAPGPGEVRRWADSAPGGAPLRLIGASGDGPHDVREIDLRGPLALVFGNETHGLSHTYREACDALVRIPMPGAPSGAADSLNVATAAAILLYETLRQRS